MSDGAARTPTRGWIGHEVLTIVARLLLAVTFVWAAWHKIIEPAEFALTVATYQILPLSLINLQAIGLPWVELIVGVMLVAGIWTRESALVTVGMNLMFIIAIVITLHRGDEIMCGCFASADAGHQIGWDLVLRDAGLLAAGAYLAWAGPRRFSVDALLSRRREVTHEES
jgi:uncharacterized membrane protein YphA (DoxX/SURF4 family)